MQATQHDAKKKSNLTLSSLKSTIRFDLSRNIVQAQHE